MPSNGTSEKGPSQPGVSADGGAAATKREIELERERLAQSVGRLREELRQSRRGGLQANAKRVTAAALAGYVVAGGVHATIRLIGTRERRRREQGGSLLGRYAGRR